MSKKATNTGFKREPGYIYFVDKQGDLCRAKMAAGGKKAGKPEKIKKRIMKGA